MTMGSSMKSENKLEGDTIFRAWKTRIDLILAKNYLLGIVKGKVASMETNLHAKNKKNMLGILSNEPTNFSRMENMDIGAINKHRLLQNHSQ